MRVASLTLGALLLAISALAGEADVGEQPFTRSLGGVVIPPGLDRVLVRAHDSVHGFGGAEWPVAIRR